MALPLLTALVALPLLGALLALILWRRPQACRWTCLSVMLVHGLLATTLLFPAARSEPSGQWLRVEELTWIDALGIRFSLALDGISLVLVLLASFLGVLCVLVSWNHISTRVGPFHFFLMIMLTGVVGVFLTTDLFLFYLFWELQVVPMFFLIGIWGHANRIRATLKFVLYSITGSLLMLVALIALVGIHGAQTGHYTFSLVELLKTTLSPQTEMWLFAAFVLAFGIKIPVFPVHTWLPDAHTEAPTAASVILAGLLLKTGTYALLRFGIPLFPGAAKEGGPFLMGLGLIGLFYAAWIALAQKDMKRQVAYSSIGHMGIIVIGLAVWNTLSLSGAVLQMVNHGLTTSALFILVGMLDERAHTRDLDGFGGLWKRMPVFSGFFLLFAMASLGLPGLNNFIGELLVLVGTFTVHPRVAAAGFLAMVPVLVYTLRLVQEVVHGEPRQEQEWADLSGRELAILAPLAIAVLWMGLHPGPLLDLLQDPIHNLVEQAGRVLTVHSR